jgi:AraC family transcriptional regulator
MKPLASRIEMIGNGLKVPISERPPIGAFHLGQDVIVEQHATPGPAEYGEFAPTTYLVFLYDNEPVKIEGRFGGVSRQEQVHPGQLWVVPQHVAHYCMFGGPHGGVVLSIGSAELERHAHTLVDGQNTQLTPQINVEDAQLRHTMLGLLAVARDEPSPDALVTDLLVQAICVRILKRYGRSKPRAGIVRGGLPAARLRRVLDYIHSNLGRNIRLLELAEISSTSLYHFVTLFKQSTGLSPYQYVLRQRIERAKGMLLERKPTILDVSLSLGFEHPNNFARTFRRLTGASPTQFRRDNLVMK